MAIEHINEFDTLNAGREKINKALDDANAVLIEATDKDVISAPEIIVARGGAQTLGERLDSEKAESLAKANEFETDINILDKKMIAKEQDVIARLDQKANKKELDVERKRIDSFTSLPAGSTTGDAELIDARIGVDGTTYRNTGDAIRTQYRSLKEDANRLEENDVIANITDNLFDNRASSWTKGDFSEPNAARKIMSEKIPTDSIDNLLYVVGDSRDNITLNFNEIWFYFFDDNDIAIGQKFFNSNLLTKENIEKPLNTAYMYVVLTSGAESVPVSVEEVEKASFYIGKSPNVKPQNIYKKYEFVKDKVIELSDSQDDNLFLYGNSFLNNSFVLEKVEMTRGGINSATGEENTNPYFVSDFLNTTDYEYGISSNGVTLFINYYDSSKTFMKSVNITNNKIQIEKAMPYMRLCLYKGGTKVSDKYKYCSGVSKKTLYINDHFKIMSREVFIPDKSSIIRFESGDDNSVYFKWTDGCFLRGGYPTLNLYFSKNDDNESDIYLSNHFDLANSPSGDTGFIKIPHNYSFVWSFDSKKFEIVDTSAVNLKDKLVIFSVSMGFIVGGLGQYLYTQYKSEKQLDNLDNKLDKIKAISLPDYWMTYIDNKMDTIKQFVEDCDESFIFITDVHTPSNQMHSPNIIKYIQSKINIPKVLAGGDYETASSTRRGALNMIDKWFENANNWFSVRGNHDNNYQGTGEVSAKDFYVRAVKPLGDDIVAMQYLENVFYMDDKNAKFRYIFLDTEEEGIKDMSAQTTWMKDRINELPSGWNVIIMCHMYFEPSPISANENNLKVINSGSQIKEALDSIYDTCKANIVAYLVGHCHRDHHIYSEKGYPIISTTCDAQQADYWDLNYPTRTTGTTLEQAFDIYGIDTINRTIKALRIGAGAELREFTY